jgi:hypothetical protein
MGKPREPLPVKLFMSLIIKEENVCHQAMDALKIDFGEMDLVSEQLPFDFTDYYTPEMGANLFRRLITFAPLVSRGSLPDIKLTTNRLEETFSDSGGKRRINIDPGYLSQAHIILATTKGYAHRPYLAKGIYADLTLIYRNKSFQPLDWTYPDYRQKRTVQLFNEIRMRYVEKLKEVEDCLC